MGAQECIKELRGDGANGLTDAEAKRRLSRYGKNELRGQKPRGFFCVFISQFKDFMLLILLAAAGISFATALLEEGGDYLDPIVILVIVVLNALVSAAQERRAQKSLQALKAMGAPRATVLRGGRERSIPAAEVVPGDIVCLRAGDLVPTDCRVLDSVGLRTQESALTGESLPTDKAPARLNAACPLAERRNMLFSSTEVAAGHGRGLVVGTGMNTELGKIAKMLGEEESPQTPLQKRLVKVGKLLSLLALAICALIFVVHLLQRQSIMNSFLLAVSLAVAAVPEGLPATVTVVLSLGVQRMARRGAVLRSLTAVEALGTATVICSDKTGTLTQNQMRVTRLLGGDGHELEQYSPAAMELLKIACLCNNARLSAKGAVGEATEKAILLAARRSLKLEELRRGYPRVDENPFSSARKMMSTLHRDGSGYLLACKGAPDVLLPHCGTAVLANGEAAITPEGRQLIAARVAALAGEGLRVLAVARRKTERRDIQEEELCFCGLIAMQDPPREGVKQAVETCRMAGITPIMITGDHAGTALAIASQLGIAHNRGSLVTGRELDEMDGRQLEERLSSARVFARVTPEHKLRIVKALRARGEVVAMTGDGVNDAPALKAADIGCAMGRGGTEVAKSASDMVLTDDNFSTIVAAVEEGRGIYDNIKKAVHFLLGCNIGEILLILLATLLGMPAPLLPIQLLLVNLVTDSLPAMALGTEPKARDIMERKPIPPKRSLFAGGLGLAVALEGCLIALLSLAAFSLGCGVLGGSLTVGRTMCFATLSLSELVHTLNMRSEGSALRAGLFKNRALLAAIAVCALLQLAVISLPELAGVFASCPLNGAQWLVVGGLSLAPLALMELIKLLSNGASRGKFAKNA